MFGYLIPRNYMEDMQFDSENKNSNWYDAIKLEMESMSEHKVFKKWDKAVFDKHKKVTNPPKGCHRIKVHLVFAIKFNRSLLSSGGLMADVPGLDHSLDGYLGSPDYAQTMKHER